MKKILIAFIIILIITLLLVHIKNINSSTELQKNQDKDEIIEMTDQEKRILKELYIDEERIEQGKLYKYQKICLSQLRFGIKYLKEKYPNKNFEITNIHPKTKINMITRIDFYEINDTMERFYTLTIDKKMVLG